MTGYLESVNNSGVRGMMCGIATQIQFAHHFTYSIPVEHLPLLLESILYLFLNKTHVIYTQKLQTITRGRQTLSGLLGKSKPAHPQQRG